MNNPIILFDGVCNLCNGFVQFVIKRDKDAKFRFGSLQSETVKNILIAYNFENQKLQTVIFIENNILYTQSTAVLKIAKQLGGIWQLLYVFMIVPAFFRDWIYERIAKSRYKIFGQRDTCMVPTSELKNRFLD